MRFTEFNEEIQLYVATYDIDNIIQKLGIIEDMMYEHAIFSLKELKEVLDNDSRT